MTWRHHCRKLRECIVSIPELEYTSGPSRYITHFTRQRKASVNINLFFIIKVLSDNLGADSKTKIIFDQLNKFQRYVTT